MKIKITTTMIFLITLSVSACTLQGTPVPRADNFSFVFQFLPCDPVPSIILDTDTETLAYRRIGEANYSTLSIQLTEEELETIYKTALRIGFFDYPQELTIPEEEVNWRFSPASSYQLSITNGEVTNSVFWNDNVEPVTSNKKTDQLMALVTLIEKVIQSHPETQAFLNFEAGCVP